MTPIKNLIPDVLALATTTPPSGEIPGLTHWQPTLDAHDQSLREAAAACSRFVKEMASKVCTPRWLTLNGEAGCGKTMLARQVFVQSLGINPGSHSVWVDPTNQGKRRPRCVWLDASDMAERMKGGEFDLPEYLADDFFVVLDDLGAVRDKTDFMADAVYRLCANRREGWTMFTSNLTISEIAERVDERVASRLIRDLNKQVRITAGDYALRGQISTPARSAVLSAPSGSPPPEPRKWREWLLSAYPEESWAETASKLGWYACPLIWKVKIDREMQA